MSSRAPGGLRVVWDFGGVLFRWDPAAVLARTLPHRMSAEHDPQHWKEQFFLSYRGEWGEFDRGTLGVEEMVTRIARRTGLAEAEVQAVVDAVPGELQPIAGSVALLQALHQRGHRLHFLSNMPRPLAEHLQGRHDFLRLFESGVYSSHVQLTKPDPALFALAQARFDAKPDELVFVDDHPENIDAAIRMGWQALPFTGPADLQVELRRRSLLA